jgi:hypothetical protein
MIPYATITGTRRNLTAMRAHGWRLLLTPDTMRSRSLPPDWPYAVDNGAWGCFQRGAPFDVVAFVALVDAYGAGADWVVLPDIVGGGVDSLAMSISWLPRIRGPVLLAVQDGMTPADVLPHIGGRVGLFLGGSTDWKLATMRQWGRAARAAGCDGTSPTRFAISTPKLTAAVRQGHLFGGLDA